MFISFGIMPYSCVYTFFMVCCRAVDPGAVKTNIMHELPSYIQVIAFCGLKILGLMQSPEDAAESVIDAALAPPVRYDLLEFFILSASTLCG
jgi:hypothetical protein